MKFNLKKISPSLSFAGYRFLDSSLPQLAGQSSPTSFEQYAAMVFRGGVLIAVGLAVFMLSVAGFQYLMFWDPNSQSSAKKTIMETIFGLALVLLSYLILYSINPDYINFSITLPN